MRTIQCEAILRAPRVEAAQQTDILLIHTIDDFLEPIAHTKCIYEITELPQLLDRLKSIVTCCVRNGKLTVDRLR